GIEPLLAGVENPFLFFFEAHTHLVLLAPNDFCRNRHLVDDQPHGRFLIGAAVERETRTFARNIRHHARSALALASGCGWPIGSEAADGGIGRTTGAAKCSDVA